MTHLVTENCIKCNHTNCVTVCPVDCFYEGPNFLAIDPDGCIDCGVCIPECPVNAIIPDDDQSLTKDQRMFWHDLNYRLSKKWPNITTQKPALNDAEKWDGVPDKLKYLEE